MPSDEVTLIFLNGCAMGTAEDVVSLYSELLKKVERNIDAYDTNDILIKRIKFVINAVNDGCTTIDTLYEPFIAT